ncbi:dipeptide ABC transporter ATP-binding protein [Escherichia coli]|nr:dipeptide ABC transporter ATP-binding protein [Escherichia coli]
MALLNVDKLSVHFGDESAPFRAVDRISYSVKQGEVVGIVGESGSGKSVSSLAIMGLIDYPGRVMAEKLEFNGQDLQRISEKERRNLVGAEVAMIFQDPMTSLNPCYTVGFQIMEAIKVHQGGNKSTRRQRAIDLLNQVGIPESGIASGCLPASAFRRHEPARDDRHGDCLSAKTADCR